MEKKTKLKIAFLFLFFLLIAGIMEISGRSLKDGGKIARRGMGEGQEEVTLVLNAGDILQDYEYMLTIEEVKISRTEANEYFELAKEEIDRTFCREGETAMHVTECVHPDKSYVGGAVTAEWYFDNYEVVDPDGVFQEKSLTDDGILIQAEAELTCAGYQEYYLFSFQAYPRERSEKEALLEAVQENLSIQQEMEGEEYLTLPEQIDGVTLSWSAQKDYLIWKVLLVEALIMVLIPIIKRERKKQEDKSRKEQLLLDYPDMVSKLTVLVGSGISVKQSWNRISARYSDKKQKNQLEERLVYEEMLKTNREIQDGESERTAYQKFGERAGLYAYHRFVRILVQNLQKGTKGLCDLLEQESETAFEERKMLAKKLGEEAGTRMLFPMIIMMGIVMAIVIMPAIINFMR